MTDRFIIESFWQKADNCVSIALIKAALLRYGFKGAFRKETRGDNRLITLQNGKILALTKDDIRKLNENNKILYSPYCTAGKKKDIDKLREFAELCFAIMVRVLQHDGYNGKEYTITTAIRQLTKEGMPTDHMHNLLGLSRKKSQANKLSMKHFAMFRKKKGVILYSDTHVVTVSSGYYEEFGKAVRLEKEIPLLKGKKARYWFELK